jgi:hypothetical protein
MGRLFCGGKERQASIDESVNLSCEQNKIVFIGTFSRNTLWNYRFKLYS